MKTNIKQRENGKVTLEVEVGAPEFQEAIEKATKKLAKKVNIPGFRKGRAPKNILYSYLGKDAIYAEAVDDFLPEVYIKALEKAEIEPIDQPEIDLASYEEGDPLIFTAEIPVKPDVKLGDYKGIEVKNTVEEVTDKDVDNYLEAMQQKHAQLESITDKSLEDGNTSVIDFEGFLQGVPFEGGKGENYNLVIGSNTFIPGFEEQLIGMNINEEKEISVTFPEEYQKEELAGQDVVFKVKLNEIKVKKLMPIDDEFAKDISEFESLEELKRDVKNNLNKAKEQEIEQQSRSKILNTIAEECEVEIPNVLVDRKVDELLNKMNFRLKQQGMNLEDYMKFTNTTDEQLREQYKEIADKEVKIDLALEAIAKLENLEITDEEIDEELKEIAEQNKQPVEQIKAILQMQNQLPIIKDGLLKDKTIKFLISNANVS